MRKGIYIAIFAILTMLSGRLNAQQFPVQVTTQIIPPFSLYLSDYTRPGSNALNVTLLLNELGRFQYQGKLRITIQGQGVLLRTRDNFIPRSPVILDGGIPLQLTGADLEEYFDPRNLDFSGISRREYEQGGQLPEGFYTFCIEVLDFNRRDLVSNQGCASAWLILNDPPIINLPFNGEKERPKNPQNVIFQWTPRHTGSPNAAFTTEYVFTIVEINPTGRNPNDAIAVSRPIFETVTNSTTLVYGPAEPQLELGRQYAYRVQARDVEQRDLFKNRGFSEVNSFTYGDACQTPESVKAKALDAGRIQVSWDPKWNNTGFSVWIRETGDNNAEWYEYESLINELTIVDLKPGTEYEYEVSGSCGFFESERSPVGTVSTDIAPEVEYACGIAIDPPELQNTTPIGSLKKGDVIIAGDFKVTLSEVSGGGGSFSGTGAIILPFLNRVKVNVEFSGITVNDEFRMVVGEMDVTGVTGQILDDETFARVNDVLDELDSTLDDLREQIEQADEILAVADSVIDEVADLVDKVVDDGLFTEEEERDLAGLTSDQLKERADDLLNDAAEDIKNGDYVGGAEKLAKAADLKKRAKKLDNILDNADTLQVIAVEFTGSEKYGFDKKESDYHRLDYDLLIINGQEYGVPWVSANADDNEGNTVNINHVASSGVEFDDIYFRYNGDSIAASTNGNSWAVDVPSGNAKDINIIDAVTNGANGQQKVGKAQIVTYSQLNRKVYLVPVNDQTYPYEQADLASKLNEVYGQAAAQWEVLSHPAITVEDWDGTIDDDEQALLSTYSQEMRQVIRKFKKDYQEEKDAFYLFMVPNSSTDKLGYMPRKRQFGFIYVNEHSSGDETTLKRTIAHELGHGAFRLQHTFEEYPNIAQGTTDNLMDYGLGTKLKKYQWDLIHNPPVVIGYVEDLEEGSRVLVTDFSRLSRFTVDGWLTFMSPGGVPISLKLDKLQEIHFATSKDEDELFEFPIGTLARFKYDDITYLAKKAEGANTFTRYGDYSEDFSSEKRYENILGGIPCLQNNDIVFKIFPMSVVDNFDIPVSNTGRGEIKDELHFASAFSDVLTDQDNIVDIHVEFLSGEDVDGVNFLVNYANSGDLCGTEAFYAFKIVSLLEEYQSQLISCMDNIGQDVDDDISNQAGALANRYLYNNFNSDHIQVSNKDQIYLDAYNDSYSNIVSDSYMRFYYRKLEEYLLILKDRFDNAESLTDQNVKKIISFLNIQSYNAKNCMLEYLSDEIKFALIKKLALGTDFSLIDRKERLIIDLVTSIQDQKTFIEKLETQEKSFFWDLLEDFDWTGEEYDVLVSKVTEMVYNNKDIVDIAEPIPTLLINPDANVAPKFIVIHKDKTITIDEENNIIGNYSTVFERLSNNDAKVTSTAVVKKANDYYAHAGVIIRYPAHTTNSYAYGNPLALVKVQFSSDFQIAAPDGTKIDPSKEYNVPLFWLKWFLEEQESIERAAAIRVLLNLGAIGVSIATLEPGPILFIELVINGADIIVAINEDQIISQGTDYENELLSTYNNLMAVYGIAVGTHVAGTITKNLYSFATKTPFKTKLKTVKNSLTDLNDISVGVRNVFTKTVTNVGTEWNGYNAWKTFQESLYFEAEVYKLSKEIKRFEMSVEQANKVVLELLSPTGQVAKRAQIAEATGDIGSGTMFLSNLSHYDETIHGARAPDSEIVGELNNVLVKEGENINVKSYEVYEGSLGSFYVLEKALSALTGPLKVKLDNLIEAGTITQSKGRTIATELIQNTDLKNSVEALGDNADDLLANFGKIDRFLDEFASNLELVDVWKLLNEGGSTLSGNISAIQKMDFLKAKGLTDIQLKNIGGLNDIKAIELAEAFAKRRTPYLTDLDLIAEYSMRLNSYKSDALQTLTDMAKHNGLDNPEGLLDFAKNNSINPTEGAKEGWKYELDVFNDMLKNDQNANFSFSKYVPAISGNPPIKEVDFIGGGRLIEVKTWGNLNTKPGNEVLTGLLDKLGQQVKKIDFEDPVNAGVTQRIGRGKILTESHPTFNMDEEGLKTVLRETYTTVDTNLDELTKLIIENGTGKHTFYPNDWQLD